MCSLAQDLLAAYTFVYIASVVAGVVPAQNQHTLLTDTATPRISITAVTAVCYFSLLAAPLWAAP
jgi:hypothetical protein